MSKRAAKPQAEIAPRTPVSIGVDALAARALKACLPFVGPRDRAGLNAILVRSDGATRTYEATDGWSAVRVVTLNPPGDAEAAFDVGVSVEDAKAASRLRDDEAIQVLGDPAFPSTFPDVDAAIGWCGEGPNRNEIGLCPELLARCDLVARALGAPTIERRKIRKGGKLVDDVTVRHWSFRFRGVLGPIEAAPRRPDLPDGVRLVRVVLMPGRLD